MTKIFLLDVGADFVTKIFDYFSDLIYQKIIALLGDFFGVMNATGYDLFGMPWVQQIVQLFSNLGWALFVVGIIVALFEFAIESQNGRGDPKALALNIIKGFFAVNLFWNVPVQLYGLAVSLQSSMSADMTGLISPEGSGTLLNACLDVINGFLFDPLLGILIAVMMGYSVIKVFFASIKRGGILLIQIAIGSLYMFSVPRGFNDGFVMWVKQVIATCLTAFLQSTMLVCGLILFKDYWLLGNYACGGRNSEDRWNVRTGNLGASQHKQRYQYGAVGGSPQADGYRRIEKIRGYQKYYVHLSRQPKSSTYAVLMAVERPCRDRNHRVNFRVRYGADGVHDTADRNHCLRLSGDTVRGHQHIGFPQICREIFFCGAAGI